jgi:hypothetical protein
MSSQQVMKTLGQPTVHYGNTGDHALEYSSLGFVVCFDENDRVLSFTASSGSPDPKSPLKAFAGITEKGIAIGSTEEKVIHSYGPPTSRKTYGGGVLQLLYQGSGQRLVFRFSNGRVDHITAVKKTLPNQALHTNGSQRGLFKSAAIIPPAQSRMLLTQPPRLLLGPLCCHLPVSESRG